MYCRIRNYHSNSYIQGTVCTLYMYIGIVTIPCDNTVFQVQEGGSREVAINVGEENSLN